MRSFYGPMLRDERCPMTSGGALKDISPGPGSGLAPAL
jgi:hypothetical protein